MPAPDIEGIDARSVVIRHVRDTALGRQAAPIGCIAVIRTNDAVGFSVGWSKCRAGDTYDKRFGRVIAIRRAISLRRKPLPREFADDAWAAIRTGLRRWYSPTEEELATIQSVWKEAVRDAWHEHYPPA